MKGTVSEAVAPAWRVAFVGLDLELSEPERCRRLDMGVRMILESFSHQEHVSSSTPLIPNGTVQ